MASGVGHEAGLGAGPFRRVAACVTVSPHLAAIVNEVSGLAGRCGSEVVFLHVGEDGAEVEAAVRKELRKQPAPMQGAGFVSRVGDPASVILKEARQQGADLVYAGAMREDALLRGIVGSVARRLARWSDRSVYLSLHHSPLDWGVRSMVAAVDFDEESEAMMRRLVQFVRCVGVEVLHIVHEYDPFSVGVTESTGSGGGMDSEYESTAAVARRFRFADFLSRVDLEGVNVKTALLRGRDGGETTLYAERHVADLLAVPGPRRRLGLLDRFFGHPTETILLRLPCSLLVYREPARVEGGTVGGGAR